MSARVYYDEEIKKMVVMIDVKDVVDNNEIFGDAIQSLVERAEIENARIN